MDNFTVSSCKVEIDDSLKESISKNLSATLALFEGCNVDGFIKKLNQEAKHMKKVMEIICGEYDILSDDRKETLDNIAGITGWLSPCGGKWHNEKIGAYIYTQPHKGWGPQKVEHIGTLKREYWEEARHLIKTTIDDRYIVVYTGYHVDSSGTVILCAEQVHNDLFYEKRDRSSSTRSSDKTLTINEICDLVIEDALKRKDCATLKNWLDNWHTLMDRTPEQYWTIINPFAQKFSAAIDLLQQTAAREQNARINIQNLTQNVQGDGIVLGHE